MASPMRSLTYLNKSDSRETTNEWEEADRGVIIPVGMASEVLIPWHRVLEIWDGRGEIPRD